jgi:hypothetical protein
MNIMELTPLQIAAIVLGLGATLFIYKDKLKSLLSKVTPTKRLQPKESSNQDSVLKNLLDFRANFEKDGLVYNKLTETIELVLREEPIAMSSGPTIDVEEIDKIIEGLNELKKGNQE